MLALESLRCQEQGVPLFYLFASTSLTLKQSAWEALPGHCLFTCPKLELTIRIKIIWVKYVCDSKDQSSDPQSPCECPADIVAAYNPSI